MTPRSIAAALLACTPLAAGADQDQVLRVPLVYAAPDTGPKPSFSPKGTQVRLTFFSWS